MTRAQLAGLVGVAVLLSGCGLLSTPSQKTQDALMHAVSRAATAVLSESGYRPDIEGAICIDASDLADEAWQSDVPMAVCWVPGMEVGE